MCHALGGGDKISADIRRFGRRGAGVSGARARRSPLGAALDAAAKAPPVAPAEQLGLLPADQAAAAPAERQRGPGRPPGAANRSTEEWRRYLLARYRSPLEGLLRLANQDLGELQKELVCDKLEAFKLQVQAMVHALPFVHQKLPLAIEAKGGLVNLTIGEIKSGPGGLAGSVTIEGEVIQALSDAARAELDAAELDDGAEPQAPGQPPAGDRLTQDQPGRPASPGRQP